MERRPYIGPLLLLALLALLFLNPILWPPPGAATGGADVRALFVPWLTFAREALRAGRLPLWDPFHFAGYPFLSNPQVAFFYPPTWLAWLLPVRLALSLQLAFHLWLMGAGTWLFLRRAGATQTGALLAALTFTFSGFSGARIFAGHLGLLATIAWLPWLLFALLWATGRRHWLAGFVAGIPFGLAILAGHTASLIYLAIVWGALALYLVWQERDAVVFRQLVLAVGAGLALSAVQLLPLIQFGLASGRAMAADFEFASNYSLPPAHLITMLVPEYFGEPTRAGYWSVPVFEELTFYAGILPLLLLPLAVRRPRRDTLLYLALMVAGLWLAMGRYSPLYQLAFRWLPPLQLARAPGRFALLFTFSAAALAGLTLSQWQRRPAPRLTGRVLRGAAGVGVLSGVAALAATGALFAAQHPSDTSGRLWHQIGGWGWLVLMLLLGAALLWALLRPQPPRRARFLAGALLLLALADLWQLSYKFVRPEATAPAAMWADARALIGDTEERVLPWGLSIFEQNGAGQAGLRSVFGYNALEPAATLALAGSIPDPRSTAYDVLAVGYVIAEAPQDAYLEGERALALHGQMGNAWVYRRARALSPVRLVSRAEVIAENEAALARLHEPDFDPGTTAIVAEAPGCELAGAAGAGAATLVSHEATRWEVETESDGPALLVVAETAYPGWRVTVDGEAARPLVAYTALRAVCVPGGRHVVTWYYRPIVLYAGGLVSMVAIVALSIAACRFHIRPRTETCNA
jgi:hypothetical protein